MSCQWLQFRFLSLDNYEKCINKRQNKEKLTSRCAHNAIIMSERDIRKVTISYVTLRHCDRPNLHIFQLAISFGESIIGHCHDQIDHLYLFDALLFFHDKTPLYYVTSLMECITH